MASDRKPVTVHYRKYVCPVGGTKLEQMVQTAMNTQVNGAKVKDRYTSRLLTYQSDNFLANIFADSAADGSRIAFGDVIHFTQGHMQAFLQITEPTSAQLPVRQMAAPAQSEYVHSQMFWLIKGDHVFMIQSMSLQTEALEKYLGWLLGHHIPAFDGAVTLATKFDASAMGGDLNDIKELVIGGAIAGPQSTSSAPETDHVIERARDVTVSGEVLTRGASNKDMVRGVLEAILNDDAAAADKVLQTVPPDAELHVQVHIGYKTRKRKVDRTTLRDLEVGLRHVPDSQLSVVARGSSRAPDGNVRLHHDASVRLIKAQTGDSEIVGSLLDPTDAMRAMVQAYSVMLADGKISE